MGHRRIPSDSWGIIERVIRRYPEQKEWYKNEIVRLTMGTPYNDGQPRGNYMGNPIESTVMKMNSPRMERAKREIDAVEKIYNKLSPKHQKVIRIRFWSDRQRNMPYLWMQRCVSYSEIQMKRISGSFVINVGKEIGEI